MIKAVMKQYLYAAMKSRIKYRDTYVPKKMMAHIHTCGIFQKHRSNFGLASVSLAPTHPIQPISLTAAVVVQNCCGVEHRLWLAASSK